MRVVVTGVAGFIGSQLAERLLADGASVVGIDSFTDYYDPDRKRLNLGNALDDAQFTLVQGGLTEIELRGVLDGAQVIYHLAGQPGVRVSWGENFEVYARDNVLATQKVLEAAKDAPLDRFVFASSSAIYGEAESFPTAEGAMPRPVSPYGVTKLAAEHLCRLYGKGFGVPATVLRYFSVYGPRQRPDMAFSRFIEAALAGDPVSVYGDGLQSRDFTFVGDVVEATVAAAARAPAGGTYNVAGGSQVTVLDAITTIERALERSIKIEHRPAVPGDPRRTGGDISAAREDFGYQPSVEFGDGLVAQVEERLAMRS